MTDLEHAPNCPGGPEIVDRYDTGLTVTRCLTCGAVESVNPTRTP